MNTFLGLTALEYLEYLIESSKMFDNGQTSIPVQTSELAMLKKLMEKEAA